jgi:hypothetical protein
MALRRRRRQKQVSRQKKSQKYSHTKLKDFKEEKEEG